MLDLSIILVSHGHDRLLARAIAALVPALEGVNAEVIMVDNLGHTDFAKDIPQQPFDVRVLSNIHPAGLSRNTNQAATMARGRFLLMINPDTEFHQGRLADAIHYMDEHPEAGALGCRLLYPDGRLQQTYRQFPIVPVIAIRGLYASRWPFQPEFYKRSLMQDVKLDQPTAVDWMLGAWLMMRRDDFFAIRGLDERFFLYYEDIDLCYRIHERGQKVVYFPDLIFYHRYDRGSAKAPLGKAWQMHASSICKYFWKHGYVVRPRYAAPYLPKAGAA